MLIYNHRKEIEKKRRKEMKYNWLAGKERRTIEEVMKEIESFLYVQGAMVLKELFDKKAMKGSVNIPILLLSKNIFFEENFCDGFVKFLADEYYLYIIIVGTYDFELIKESLFGKYKFPIIAGKVSVVCVKDGE